MLDELIAPLGIPAIANVPVGHGKHMATMPLGVRARIDGDAKTLEVLEPAVEPRTDTTRERRRVMRPATDLDGAQPAGGDGRAGARRLRAGDGAGLRRQGRPADRLVAGPEDAEPVRRRERGGVHDLGDQLGVARRLQPGGPHPGAGDRGELGRLRGRQDRHLPPDQGREVVRRRADHLRGRQVLARDARRERPALHRLHRGRHRDQDARRAHGRARDEEAQRSAHRRPVRLHPARSTSGARCRRRSSPAATSPRCRWSGAAPTSSPTSSGGGSCTWSRTRSGGARRRRSTSSSSSATGARTRWSARSPWARSISSPRSSRRPSTASASRRGSRR